ncbi:putative protein YcbX [Halomonadaceae bacterium LMG 33818]
MPEAMITALYCYPVKSLGGIELSSCPLGEEGLLWDRRWMLVDSAGRFLTQRQLPALAAIKTRLLPHELQLIAPNGRRLQIPLAVTDGPIVQTKVHGNSCAGIDEGDEAASWFEEQMGDQWSHGIRLLRFIADSPLHRDATRRIGVNSLARAGMSDIVAHTGFADGYPLLITSTRTLQLLNQVLQEHSHLPVEMSRFRPNIVVSDLAPFEEYRHAWFRLKGSPLLLWAGKPCERCPVIKVDQSIGEIADRQEPLALLRTFGPIADKAIFGMNALPFNLPAVRERVVLHVGDVFELHDKMPSAS